MFKYFLIIFLSLLFSNLSLAKDINIQENINLKFVCDFEKKIIKNSKYNYQTFLAEDLNEKGLDKFEILSKQPETLSIKGLTLFLSESAKLNRFLPYLVKACQTFLLSFSHFLAASS